jgi:hypothetical protein
VTDYVRVGELSGCPAANENTVLSLKRFNPQLWLPTLTLVWGIVSVCQGLVKNQAGLFGIRFCQCSVCLSCQHFDSLTVLGATEAGENSGDYHPTLLNRTPKDCFPA